MIGAPTPVDTSWTVYAKTYGGAVIDTLTGGERMFLSSGSGVYELMPDGSEVFRGAGQSNELPQYNSREMFTSFGNAVIKANGIAIMALTTGNFAYLTAPRAKIVESVGLFVLAFNTTEGDGWAACALGDYTDWTPSAATQAANGRLLDSAGEITAARRINDGVIAYKKRSMYYGQYVGGDIIWQWSQVTTNVGCVGKDAVVNAGGVHYFVGADDLHMFDGSYPRSIGGNIKRWFFKDADPARLKNVIAVHDRNDDHVWFWYSSKTAASGFFDTAIVYNMLTGAWGRVSQVCQDVMTYQGGTNALQIINPTGSGTVHKVQSLTGATGAASMHTFDIGDDDRYSRLSKVRPHYLTSPTSATATHYHKTHAGLAYTTGTTDTMSDHKFNFSQSARWHKLKIDTMGDFEISGLAITESVQNGNK
ncbi:MAG: hypothetical protein E6Q36_09825 [Chryseobacterium sp.]|nr:MAG: hypothetical protein E6Q36_09825 [Chryseobacterium sp.]